MSANLAPVPINDQGDLSAIERVGKKAAMSA